MGGRIFRKNADNSRNSELGLKAGIKDKIKICEKIIKNMREVRSEYEQQEKESRIRQAKAKRLNGRWM